MCTPLKHALIDHPDPAWKVAAEVPTNEVRLSKIARGRAKATEMEMERLSEILGKRVVELFPSSEHVEVA